MNFNLKFKKEAVVGPRKISVPERNEEYLLYQTLIGIRKNAKIFTYY